MLDGFDRQMSEIITQSMVEKGVDFKMESLPKSVEKQEDGRLLVKYAFNDKPDEVLEEICDTVLFAIGRFALVEDMKLEAAGVAIKDGKVDVDLNHQTNVENIYVIGDVLYKKPDLTLVAINAGRIIARHLFQQSDEIMDYDDVATTVFTTLDYGCVGLSEVGSNTSYLLQLNCLLSHLKF
jgi:pyruvate/2-oxoglutarate dehydrogenase complex dihydrolipoamide dehydrogenase (E3) component